MTDDLAASDLQPEHVGRRITYMPDKLPQTLLSVEHGGPFTIPAHLPQPDPRWFPDGHNVHPGMTVQLTVQHPDPDSEHPLYVWLVPGASVKLH